MQSSLFNHSGLFLVAVFALLNGMQDAHAEVRIALASPSDADKSGTYVWAQAFAAELERGGIETGIYANSSLGKEIVRAEQLLLGLLEVNICGTQEIEPFTDFMSVLVLPFFFRDSDELDRLIDETDFLDRLNEKALGFGMRVVDIAYLGGMGGLFTAREPVRTVEDVGSFRMRAMTAEQLDYFEAWGGVGVQVAWEEVPQALQTGIVDGYLNPAIVAVSFGHGGQLDYFMDLRIVPSTRVISVSERWYQSLDDRDRAVVDRAFVKARRANREWLIASRERDFRLLAEVGIEVVVPSSGEREAFREKLLPLYSQHAVSEALEAIEDYMNGLRTKR